MLRRISFLFIIVCVFVLVSNACGGGVNMKEGEWEITSEASIKGMPGGMSMPATPPMTYKQCLTKKDLVPQGKSQQNQQCKMVKKNISGNTVSYTMECDTPGGKITQTGKITYKGDSFQGTFTTKIPQGGMEMTGKMNGRRIGACK